MERMVEAEVGDYPQRVRGLLGADTDLLDRLAALGDLAKQMSQKISFEELVILEPE